MVLLFMNEHLEWLKIAESNLQIGKSKVRQFV